MRISVFPCLNHMMLYLKATRRGAVVPKVDKKRKKHNFDMR